MTARTNDEFNDILAQLRLGAEQRYGSVRVSEIDDQLQHLAKMISHIRAESLGLRDEIPLVPGSDPRGEM